MRGSDPSLGHNPSSGSPSLRVATFSRKGRRKEGARSLFIQPIYGFAG